LVCLAKQTKRKASANQILGSAAETLVNKEAEMQCCAILACVWLTGAAPIPAQSKDTLRGTWSGTEGESEGKKFASGTDFTVHTDNRFHLRMGKTLYEGTFTLDSKDKTNTIDLKVTAMIPLDRPVPYPLDERGAVAGFQEQTWLGIYAMDSGTLKICFGKKGRPQEFTTKAGSDHLLYLLEKPKPRDNTPAKPPTVPSP
jgi:uncharacterized protein (TIGR03067 family)